MINHFRFYEIYTAITLHFKSGSYDFWKYKGVINITEKSFQKSKEKYIFQKFADKCDSEEMAVGYCVSNIMSGNTYIRSFNMEEYKKWISYRDAVSYKFEEEWKIYLKERKGRDSLECLMELSCQKIISFEFIILLNHIMSGHIFNELDKKNNFLWEEMKEEIILYSPFIIKLWNIDKDIIKTLRKIILNNI